MKSYFFGIGLATALSFAALANATTCPAETWCFGGNPQQVSNGATYSVTGLGTITAFGEQVNTSTQNLVTTPVKDNGTSTESGLFQVNDSVNDEGIGIAPYDPAEGSSGSMANQLGLDDDVAHNNPSSGTYGNIIELELGSNIAQGTSLSFLLQAGIGASGDQVTVYTEDTGTNANPVNPSGMGAADLTTALGAISTDGTTPQFTITKNTSGIEFVAIEADCHYLLLDTITGAPGTPAVPEPRFYGILLTGLVSLAGIGYQKRRAAQATS
jgi:hypothetical protein